MRTIRLLPGARVARAVAAASAVGTLSFFVGTAVAQADVSSPAAPTSSDAVSAQPQVTTVFTSSSAADPTVSLTDTVTTTATSSSASTCPSAVQIVLDSITVSGNQVTISFTHTGPECPDASPSVLHVHENLLRAPHAGSDPVQLNQDFNIGPGSGNSVTVPLLDAVDGKCFVQVDAHASGVNRGQFFPTANCPSTSSSASESSSPSQVVNPPSPPAGPSSTAKVVVPPASSPAPLANQGGPVLASTGARAVNPLVIGASLLLAGAMLLAAGAPGRRWRTGLRAARTIWAGGRH